MHRAALYVGGPNEYVPELFLDPEEARAAAEKAEQQEEFLDEATDEMYESLGFT